MDAAEWSASSFRRALKYNEKEFDYYEKIIKAPQVVTVDNLAQKREQLALFRGQFDTAVAMVTQTIEDLDGLNINIDKTLEEIEDYQKNLEGLRLEMIDTRTKNEKVVKNFKALLATD